MPVWWGGRCWPREKETWEAHVGRPHRDRRKQRRRKSGR